MKFDVEKSTTIDASMTKVRELVEDFNHWNAWSMGMMNVRAKKLKCGGFPFEQYWNSPMEVEPIARFRYLFLPRNSGFVVQSPGDERQYSLD